MRSPGSVIGVASLLLAAGLGSGLALDHGHRADMSRGRDGQITLIEAGLAARVGDLRRLIGRIGQLSSDGRRDIRARGLDELTRGTSVSDVNSLEGVAGRLVAAASDGSAPSPGSAADLAVSAPGALVAAELARDLGAPRSVRLGSATDSRLLVFWPRYATAAQPFTTTERRALFTGWLVALVSPETAVAAPLSAARRTGLDARLDLVTTGDGPLQRSAGEVATQGDPIAAGLSWHLQFQPASEGVSVALWAPLGLGGLGALGVLWVGWLSERRQRVVQRGYSMVRAQARMLGDLGASLQESLDLGTVLPGALARLSKELGLVHVAVATRDASGQFQEVLSLGNPGSTVAAVWTPPGAGEERADNHTTPAGALTAVPLRRDLRTIGRLTFVASRELDQSASAVLASSADLIAGAVANALLFEREQETVRRLRDVDALKDSFLATVSHELRTPLTVLTGFTELLNESWDQLSETDRRDAVARMQTHNRRLLSLVNDILAFSTNSHFSAPIVITELDLGDTVGRHLDDLAPLLANHTLTTTIEPGVLVHTDATAVERIVTNLVSNAVKFALPVSEIEVRVSREEGWGLLAVSDHGPGISAEDQEHIFQLFYRGKSNAAQTTGGVGIGLAVVADWVSQIGGQVAVESAPGAGTTMLLRLPVLENRSAHIATHV